MLLPVSFVFTLAGVVLAGYAALAPDTGVDGTIGAYLALAGAVGSATLLGILLVDGLVPARFWAPVLGFVLFVMILTAIAAFFLMQTLLLAAMVVAALALLASRFTTKRRVVL
ncbi:MAG: hypothetical protein B7Z10_05375 [Rhodobacterales bacterium 32-66-7]|nr:MAG: hypothetical protein B7Z31_07695 [Rhodobacterales bacterium 12-65-15]OYX25720.1 MAG: hypothetical protein B7Z10_05375 [Rhodobacterales bacterium 32-66-7]